MSIIKRWPPLSTGSNAAGHTFSGLITYYHLHQPQKLTIFLIAAKDYGLSSPLDRVPSRLQFST
jgi:hypothetical protein